MHRIKHSEQGEMKKSRNNGKETNASTSVSLGPDYSPKYDLKILFNYDLKMCELLPQEIIMAIFGHLGRRSLCNVLLTSKYFHTIGLDRSLWAKITIPSNQLINRDEEDVEQFFEIPRYKNCRLDLSDLNIFTKRLSFILHRSLKSNMSFINLSRTDLAGVPRDLLGEVVSRSTNVSLSRCKGLRPSRLEALFTHCSKSSTLVSLDLSSVDLTSVPIDLLSATMERLKILNIKSARLLPIQVKSVIQAIVNSLSLENVNLDGVLLSDAQSEYLKKMAKRLNKRVSNEVPVNNCLVQ